MASGIKSLASKVFGGERRSRLNRKPGFAESGKNLFRGVFAGVTD